MSRSLFLAALLASTAALGACTIITDGDDPSNTFDDPVTRSCLQEAVETCYLQQLPADACATLIEQQCLGNMPVPPGDPGDPDCTVRVFDDCVASGIDEMTCWAIAEQQCNNQPPGDPPCDPPPPPPPDCDPMTGENCYPPEPPPEQPPGCSDPNGMCP